MEARTSSPRRLQIVVQKRKGTKGKEEEEWEQPKGNPAAQFSGY